MGILLQIGVGKLNCDVISILQRPTDRQRVISKFIYWFETEANLC